MCADIKSTEFNRTYKLLEATRLSPSQVAEKTALALRPETWTGLCPLLTLGAEESGAARWPADATASAMASARLHASGYMQTAPLIPDHRLELMRAAVIALKAAGWPPVFVFVFNEFWDLWRSAPVGAVLRGALGDDYRMRLWMWCYYVHPIRGARGWPPHADGFGHNGLSAWIPLGDSTVENGCIYLIPRDLLSDNAKTASLFDSDEVSATIATELLQCARPLPALAGSLLAWQFDVIHWGGVAQGGGPPRISLSAEFLPAAYANTPEDDPAWIPRHGLPSFQDRLRVIAANLQRFAVNDAWSFKFSEVGNELAAALGHS